MFLWWVMWIPITLQHIYVTYAYSYIINYTGVRMLKLLNSKPVPRAGVIFNNFFTKTRHCFVWEQVELLLVYICALIDSKSSPRSVPPRWISEWFLTSRSAGGFSHWHVIRICACLLGCFFAKFGIAIGGGGVHQRQRSPNYINWVYFGQIIVKSTQFGQNCVLFILKWYTDWWEIRQKNWYRESRILEVRHAHPHTVLVKVTPHRKCSYLNHYRPTYHCMFQFKTKLRILNKNWIK